MLDWIHRRKNYTWLPYVKVDNFIKNSRNQLSYVTVTSDHRVYSNKYGIYHAQANS